MIYAVLNNNGQQWTTVDNNGQQWTTMGNNSQQWTTICGASCISHAVFLLGYICGVISPTKRLYELELVWRLSYLNWWELKAEFKRSGMAGITINCTWYVGHGRHHYKGTMISCQAESSKLRLANLGRDESAVEGQVGMESSHERRAWYVGGNMREAYNSEAQIWIRADLPPQQLPCNCHCPLPTIHYHQPLPSLPTIRATMQ